MDNAGAKRSRTYHKYFEGYTELYDENGKIKRIYTEDYYRYSGNVILHKLLVTTLYLFSISTFLIAAWLDIPVNRFWLTSIFEALVLMGDVIIGILVLGSLIAPKDMKIKEYRDVAERLPSWCMALTIGESALFILSIVMAFVSGGFSFDILLCILLFFTSGAIMLLLRCVELKAHYENIKNPLKGKVMGSKIF